MGYGIRKCVRAPFRSGAALLLVVALLPIPPALRMPHEQVLDLAQLRSGQLEIIELIVVRARRPQAVVEPSQVLALDAARAPPGRSGSGSGGLLVAMPTRRLSDHVASSHFEPAIKQVVRHQTTPISRKVQ